jgi:hypothetical protein
MNIPRFGMVASFRLPRFLMISVTLFGAAF